MAAGVCQPCHSSFVIGRAFAKVRGTRGLTTRNGPGKSRKGGFMSRYAPASDHYDRRTIALHWTTALLVGFLWVVGQTADYIPEGPVNKTVWSFHVVGGFLLAFVLVIRILWRSTSGRALPPADSGLLQVLAKATHYLLYALLVAVVVLGISNAFVRGYHLFGLVSLVQIGDPNLKKPITHWHDLAANAVLAVAIFHAAAALIHHYAWRDGILMRMIPAYRRD
jgi:cytochrome b561